MECATLLRLTLAVAGVVLAFQFYIVVTMRKQRRARERWRVLCALEHGAMDAHSVSRATGIARQRCWALLRDLEEQGKVQCILRRRGLGMRSAIYFLTEETERELGEAARVPAFPGD